MEDAIDFGKFELSKEGDDLGLLVFDEAGLEGFLVGELEPYEFVEGLAGLFSERKGGSIEFIKDEPPGFRRKSE